MASNISNDEDEENTDICVFFMSDQIDFKIKLRKYQR